MALPVWQATIVNEFGDVIPSATMTIVVESTGLPATLWQDRNGTIPLGTNGVFNANTSGFSQFFAEPDNYRVKAEQASSGFSQTWDFVVLSGDAALRDTGTGSDQVPLNSNLPTFGTAATKNTGTASDEVPLNSDLGSSSAVDSGGTIWGAGNIEYSNDPNGEYWKYPDGRAEISKSVTGSSGGFVSTSLPFSFVGNYRVSGVPTTSTTNAVISIKVSNKTANAFDFAVVANSGYTGVSCDVIISGRWK